MNAVARSSMTNASVAAPLTLGRCRRRGRRRHRAGHRERGGDGDPDGDDRSTAPGVAADAAAGLIRSASAAAPRGPEAKPEHDW